MDLAEASENLPPQLQRAGAAGVVPRGRVGRDHQLFDAHAERVQHRQGVGLGVERIDRAHRLHPVARPAAAGADDGGDHRLIFGPVAGILRADLEQGGVALAAVGVTAGRLDQVRQRRRPHHVEISADRVDQP